jgi:hypothetical protein
MAYEYDASYPNVPPDGQPENAPSGPPGRGRRRAPEPQHYPEPQAVDPQFRDPQYADPQYSEAPYAEQSYSEPQYSEQRYTEPQYSIPHQQMPQPDPQQQWDPQWDQSGLGWDQREWDQAQQREVSPQFLVDEDPRFREPVYDDPGYNEPQFDDGAFTNPAFDDVAFQTETFDRVGYPPAQRDHQEAPEPEPAPSRASSSESAAADLSPGRGAFGAAGLAVLTAVAAVAAAPVLAIVVGAGQLGLALGWSRTTGGAWRGAVLPALIGLAATVVAYSASSGSAFALSAGALGLGFIVLAAERLLSSDRSVEALANAVAGALLVVVPAGFVVAERQDSALTAGCALAGAMAVLCTALLSGAARGITVGVIAAALVGGLTAVSLASAAGLTGGLAGGALAGMFAATGAATAGRLAQEGAPTRILAQALPMALTGLAAVTSVTVLR